MLIDFKKATFEKNRLILQDSVTVDEWKELGQNLRQVEGSVQFWIGDWARFGEKKGFAGKYTDSKVYEQIAEATGFSPSTIKKFKHVAEQTAEVRESLPRGNDMSFSHFQEVAPLSPEKQREFIVLASEQNLSKRELRAAINGEDREVEEVGDIQPPPTTDKEKLSRRADQIIAEINLMPVIYRLRIRQSINK